MMGHQLETKICKTLAKNQTLLRFGFSFQSRRPRHAANKCIMRNNDAGLLNVFLLLKLLINLSLVTWCFFSIFNKMCANLTYLRIHLQFYAYYGLV